MKFDLSVLKLMERLCLIFPDISHTYSGPYISELHETFRGSADV